jgi:hypothetical protein
MLGFARGLSTNLQTGVDTPPSFRTSFGASLAEAGCGTQRKERAERSWKLPRSAKSAATNSLEYSSDQPVIFGMRPDPEPLKAVVSLNRERAVLRANSH